MCEPRISESRCGKWGLSTAERMMRPDRRPILVGQALILPFRSDTALAVTAFVRSLGTA